MGTWSIDSFGNDDAADWLAALEPSRDLMLVEATIARVLAGGDYLEAPDATEALVAAEVVAAALGRPGSAAQGKADLTRWLERVKPTPTPQLVADAVRAIDVVLAEHSELNDLWQETDDHAAWVADVQALRQRVDGRP